jgi:hypothetical protein
VTSHSKIQISEVPALHRDCLAGDLHPVVPNPAMVSFPLFNANNNANNNKIFFVFSQICDRAIKIYG